MKLQTFRTPGVTVGTPGSPWSRGSRASRPTPRARRSPVGRQASSHPRNWFDGRPLSWSPVNPPGVAVRSAARLPASDPASTGVPTQTALRTATGQRAGVPGARSRPTVLARRELAEGCLRGASVERYCAALESPSMGSLTGDRFGLVRGEENGQGGDVVGVDEPLDGMNGEGVGGDVGQVAPGGLGSSGAHRVAASVRHRRLHRTDGAVRRGATRERCSTGAVP